MVRDRAAGSQREVGLHPEHLKGRPDHRGGGPAIERRRHGSRHLVTDPEARSRVAQQPAETVDRLHLDVAHHSHSGGTGPGDEAVAGGLMGAGGRTAPPGRPSSRTVRDPDPGQRVGEEALLERGPTSTGQGDHVDLPERDACRSGSTADRGGDLSERRIRAGGDRVPPARETDAPALERVLHDGGAGSGSSGVDCGKDHGTILPRVRRWQHRGLEATITRERMT